MSRSRWADPRPSAGLRLTLSVIALAIVVLPFSILLFEVTSKGSLTKLDQRIADRVDAHNASTRDLLGVAEIVTRLGSTSVLPASSSL
jgi:hypothetical protein